MFGWLMCKPDEIIGEDTNPYLLRWHLLPRNPVFNVYLHRFLRDDDDRALHDHPWYSLSFSSADYMELVGYKKPSHMAEKLVRRKRLRPVFRTAEHKHRVILYKDTERKPIPFWTVFITGPKIREWYFWCPKGPRHWKDFCDERDHGKVGRGCN